MGFFLCSLGFHYTGIGGSFWLYRSFAYVAFLLRSLGFHNTGISGSLWLYRSFAHMAFLLCSLGFHHTGIGWILWLYGSFAHMAFLLCSLGHYDWRGIWLRDWLNVLFCPDSKNLWNWFFGDFAFDYSANFLSIYYTHFCQNGPLPILASCQHLGLSFG